MDIEKAKVGTRVRSLVQFCGVPRGTEGVIDEDYGSGVMVAWDEPDRPLPPGYSRHDGRPSFASGILRDGFGMDELDYLEVVPEHCEYCGQDGHRGGCRAHERHDARCL